jgi:hypothetical protein
MQDFPDEKAEQLSLRLSQSDGLLAKKFIYNNHPHQEKPVW